MPEIYITISVQGATKPEQAHIIRAIDNILCKYPSLNDFNIEYKNVATRKRKPKHEQALTESPVSAGGGANHQSDDGGPTE